MLNSGRKMMVKDGGSQQFDRLLSSSAMKRNQCDRFLDEKTSEKRHVFEKHSSQGMPADRIAPRPPKDTGPLLTKKCISVFPDSRKKAVIRDFPK
jgi:hypothetical protein